MSSSSSSSTPASQAEDPVHSRLATISSEIARAKPSGWTAMLDAIHLALAQMKQARNTRKALIILSDGGDNFSRRNLAQLRSTLIEAGVPGLRHGRVRS